MMKTINSTNRKLIVATVIILITVLLVGAAMIQRSLDHSEVASEKWSKSAPLETARSILDLLGGMRQTAAAYLWIKSDTIWHEHWHGDVVMDLQIYPYFRLITYLDPHYEMAYAYASYMLCAFGMTEEGFEFALEGLRNNPNSPRLQYNIAAIYHFYLHDHEKALYHIDKALKLNKNPDMTVPYQALKEATEKTISGEIEERVHPPTWGETHEILEKLHEEEHENHENHEHGEDH